MADDNVVLLRRERAKAICVVFGKPRLPVLTDLTSQAGFPGLHRQPNSIQFHAQIQAESGKSEMVTGVNFLLVNTIPSLSRGIQESY